MNANPDSTDRQLQNESKTTKLYDPKILIQINVDCFKLTRQCIVEFLGLAMICYFTGVMGIQKNQEIASIETAFVSGTGLSQPIVTGFETQEWTERLAAAIVVASIHSICIIIGGPISGGYYNPALTAAMILIREVDIVSGIAYVFSQLAGSMFAGLFLMILQPKQFKGVEYPKLTLVDDTGPAFIYEIGGTALIFLIYTSILRSKEGFKVLGATVGICYLMLSLVLQRFTGACFNPWRFVGPALFSGDGLFQKGWWIYFFAPIVGGLVGIVFGKFVYYPDMIVKNLRRKKYDEMRKESKKTLEALGRGASQYESYKQSIDASSQNVRIPPSPAHDPEEYMRLERKLRDALNNEVYVMVTNGVADKKDQNLLKMRLETSVKNIITKYKNRGGDLDDVTIEKVRKELDGVLNKEVDGFITRGYVRKQTEKAVKTKMDRILRDCIAMHKLERPKSPISRARIPTNNQFETRLNDRGIGRDNGNSVRVSKATEMKWFEMEKEKLN